ncbi:MAG: Crp/Fnr family transcriptional regulator [Pseudomonadales bacterium]|jgi:CRP-like cAMP-binding protein
MTFHLDWYGGAQTVGIFMLYPRTMTSSRHQPGVNRLLAALPERDRRHFLAAGDSVPLAGGETLHHSGRLNRVYFPTSGFISLRMTVHPGASLEVGLIGNEGACGFELALGIHRSTVRAVVQGSGSALRLTAASFRYQLSASATLARMMDRYVHVHLNQLAQLAVCTRFHVVEERLARWLLMTQDRAHSATFYLTHQLLGSILGVRRVGITKAAGTLQDRGLIEYSRGRITVLNRGGLKAASCSCYDADCSFYEKVFD